jgi:hypothetical protein
MSVFEFVFKFKILPNHRRFFMLTMQTIGPDHCRNTKGLVWLPELCSIINLTSLLIGPVFVANHRGVTLYVGFFYWSIWSHEMIYIIMS